MSEPMEIGPVELVVLSFPGSTVDPAATAALRDLVASGHVTLLDLVLVSKDAEGSVVETEVSEGLGGTGLEGLSVAAAELVSDEDLDIVRTTLEPDSSAVVVVYEQTWARRFASSVRAAGGEVELHVQIPHETAVTALVAGDGDGTQR